LSGILHKFFSLNTFKCFFPGQVIKAYSIFGRSRLDDFYGGEGDSDGNDESLGEDVLDRRYPVRLDPASLSAHDRAPQG